MKTLFEGELRTALEAVRTAAAICRAVQSTINADVLQKKDRSPVTVADYSSQAVICRALHAAFPADPIIAEEDSAELRRPENADLLARAVAELQQAGIAASPESICDWIDRGRTAEFTRRFWTLDPIDGTKGFLRGEQYAISLALIIDGSIRLAVVGCPNLPVEPDASATGALFYAIRGEGSFVVPMAGTSSPRKVRVTQTVDPASARFCESVESGHSSHGQSEAIALVLDISQPAVRLDSQAKYAVVARGEADIYLRLPTRADYVEKIWDHAGGVLIVEEAGGKATDVDGKPLEFTHGRELSANRGVIVTNGLLHDVVLGAVGGVLEMGGF
jgi:3'(2'), 5'-bisphosphate nucleotidase